MEWIENMKIIRNVMARLLIVMVALLSASVWAENPITVTDPGDSGPGTLRQAILDVDSGGTIDFAPGLGAITLTSGELFIDKDLTIVGPGSGNLTIQRSSDPGTPDFRIFDIWSGTVSISGLTVSNGRADFGGGIYNGFILDLNDCRITGNLATQSGGGIANDGGTMTMSNCVISGNAGDEGWGGGVYNGGTLDATDCTVSNNTVTSTLGYAVFGGGVYNNGGGTLTFTNSKIIGNFATGGAGANGGGAGIYNEFGSVTLDRSTVDSNSATGGADRKSTRLNSSHVAIS